MNFSKKQESSISVKKTGLGLFKIIALNPTTEERNHLWGKQGKEDEEEQKYLIERNDKPTVKLTFILEEDISKWKTQLTFELNREKAFNKNKDKAIYINQTGDYTYCDSPDNLQKRFLHFVDNYKDLNPIADKKYRQAYEGEKELMTFLQAWLSKANLNDPETTFLMNEDSIDKLFIGDYSELQALVNSEYTGKVICAVYVSSTDGDDGTVKLNQRVYKYSFCPEVDTYGKKNWPLINIAAQQNNWTFTNKEYDVKKFVKDITGEYGINQGFRLQVIKDYNPEEHLESTNETMRHSEEGGEMTTSDLNWDKSE